RRYREPRQSHRADRVAQTASARCPEAHLLLPCGPHFEKPRVQTDDPRRDHWGPGFWLAWPIPELGLDCSTFQHKDSRASGSREPIGEQVLEVARRSLAPSPSLRCEFEAPPHASTRWDHSVAFQATFGA